MKIIKCSFVVLLWCLMASSGAAQSVSLYGSVKGSDYESSDVVPADWTVSITAVRLDDNSKTRKVSKGGLYQISVPTNSVIELIFSSSNYDTHIIERIEVQGVSDYRVPPVPVTLTKLTSESFLLVKPRVRLENEKRAALITGEIDIFLYNLELLRNVSAASAGSLQEINE